MTSLKQDTIRARRYKMGRTVVALMLREMSTTYGRSPGGYVWAVLEPVGAILVLSAAFSVILRAPSLGSSFLLFFATGFLPFGMYNQLSNVAARALMFSRPLLAYPGVTFVDAIVARFVLNGLTQLMVFYIVITGILVVQDTRVILDFPSILLSFAVAGVLSLGVGVMNCVLFGLWPVWEQLWGIASRPLFLASGVFFLYDDMPDWVQEYLWYLPIIHMTGLMRRGFYPNYEAEYVSLAYSFGISAAFIALGLVLLSRYHRDILQNA